MKKSVLLADHDESVRKMLGRVLESAGYSVRQAGSPTEAAAELRAAPPDLVVWDLEIPVSAGTQQLEFKGAEAKALPVIGITAWPNQQEKAVRTGITAVLEKPLDLGLLLKTIQELLSAQEAHRPRLGVAS